MDDFLGHQNPEIISNIASNQKLVTTEQLELAKKSWQAFRQPTPEAWADLIQDDTTCLPFLNLAVHRMLEELPDPNLGITRTEHQILKLISEGISQPRRLFGKCQELEEAEFMGDASFFGHLRTLIRCPCPLIETRGAENFESKQDPIGCSEFQSSDMSLTSLGQLVLAGKKDYRKVANVNYWWGGSHITSENLWRWDAQNGRLTMSS